MKPWPLIRRRPLLSLLALGLLLLLGWGWHCLLYTSDAADE